MSSKISLFAVFLGLITLKSTYSQGFEGYYQYPDVYGDMVVFSAEGDIWKVPLSGGTAQRLTTHPEEESYPKISPDGKTLAYTASYEGPDEVYTMPLQGGLTQRWTYESDPSLINGWTPQGAIVYDTRAYATLPDRQLVTINMQTKKTERVPLSQASEASYDDSGNTVFFVRPSYHGNVTKRYKGGTARQIWKFTKGSEEATQLTTDYDGESHHPMWHDGRIYFISDRDGIMNLWSMTDTGSDFKQHTQHTGFDIRYASLDNNTIVYQLGADLWDFNLQTDETHKINITLTSDLDQLREKWIDDPENYITSVNPDNDGTQIVITARGRVFVAPVAAGRFVEFTDKKDVRYRDANFSADGKQLITLSDESGEFEFITMPANGMSPSKEITDDGKVLRFGGEPSPDGKWLAYDDLENNMFILNLDTGKSTKVSTTEEGISSYSWSPDSKYLAFVQTAANTMAQIQLYSLADKETFPITTDRANSRYPQWSPDGKFIYFLSDRNFNTLVGAPWGSRQPEPYFDASEKLYTIALQKGTRPPFRPNDELYTDKMDKDADTKKEKREDEEAEKPDAKNKNIIIDKEEITERIAEVPIKPGNYRGLGVTAKAIYLLSSGTGADAKTNLMALKIDNEEIALKTMVEDVRSFDLTEDGTKILINKDKNYYMVQAGTDKINDLSKDKIDLSNWKFSITPKQDWKQLFTDAWRMERDYFYDKNMHGVNWKAMYNKYLPLVDRITTRSELSDLIGRFVGELSALHTSVYGGDTRGDDENIGVAHLGARFSRDESAGFKIEHIYKTDPDYPDERSPLDDPYLDVKEGDVITEVNGKPALTAMDIGELIRNDAGRQVRLSVSRNGNTKDMIVLPIANSYGLRYRDWEYSRRLQVEKETGDKVGYVHLQAMGSNDINQWYREFYPVFDRPGLIIDVRHNRGGNIESFILEKLLRQPWMFWKSRAGKPYWNMQYAFRGHIVILVDENTASDGEAFAEGFKRLNLGTAIGTRTWGGEIWLGSSNRLSDNGLARAPMNGVYGNDGTWLIEGRGFEPDIEVVNMPHATFEGKDAQLEAAIDFLQKLIAKEPREVPAPPAFPDKSFNNKTWKAD